MSGYPGISLDLPATFRPDDILAFHRRDPEATAERIGDARLDKGMLWRGATACLSIRFAPGKAHAQLFVDGSTCDAAAPAFATMVHRMLGLTQDVDSFEARHRDHPQLGRLIAAQPGLRVPLAATPFEALTWAITGQQISVHAAVSLRRKLILATGVRHANGLYCYPDAARILQLSADTLRAAGFSTAKTQTLQLLARHVVEGSLPLDAWLQDFPGEDVVRTQLEALRGIGTWTVNYALLRGFGWLDGSLHGDAAVRRGLRTLLNAAEPLSESQAKDWLAQFSPWRALVGAHLWASLSGPTREAEATVG